MTRRAFDRSRLRLDAPAVAPVFIPVLAVLALLAACTASVPAPEVAPAAPAGTRVVEQAVFETPLGPLAFLAELTLAPDADRTGTLEDAAPLGGLSALVYRGVEKSEDGAGDGDGADLGTWRFLALSDDRAELGPARFYRLALEPAAGVARVEDVVVLADENGRPFAPGTVDPEGLAPVGGRSGDDTGALGGDLWISSEGAVDRGIVPFVRRMGADGAFAAELPLPRRYAIAANEGVRNNQALESLTVTPDGRHLFTAAEGPLIQDDREPTPTRGALTRILRYDLETGTPDREVVYPLEPVAAAPPVEGGLAINGLVELLALDATTLLALERSYTAGVGNSIRLYRVDLAPASNVLATASLQVLPEARRRPADKTLVLDLDRLEPHLENPVDNIEGMAFGPTLPDGRRTLVLVSDDNFNPRQQVTQILIFALGGMSPEPGR